SAGKAPGEPDQTLLLSYEAFSQSIAERRLRSLAGDVALIPDTNQYETYRHMLHTDPHVSGIPVETFRDIERSGVIALADAGKAAADFVFLRTTARAVADFLDRYDFTPLTERFATDYLSATSPVLILREAPRQLTI